MKKEPKKVIAEIAQHTGYMLSEKELDAVEEYTRFSGISKSGISLSVMSRNGQLS